MTLPAQLPPLGLDGIVLKSGAHDSRESGVCALEAVAWFAGLPHSDMPACVCPVLRAFVIAWNDGIPDDARRTALLKPFIPVGPHDCGDGITAAMKCPHCACEIETPQQRWMAQKMARGLCPRCGTRPSGRFRFCFPCRQLINARQRERYQRRPQQRGRGVA
jgi:hypothetical protein